MPNSRVLKRQLPVVLESLLKDTNATAVMPYYVILKFFTEYLETIFQIGVAFQIWRNKISACKFSFFPTTSPLYMFEGMSLKC